MSARPVRVLLALAAAIAVPATTAPAVRADANAGEITMELLVLRPLGLVTLVAGAPFYLVAAPVVAPSGGYAECEEIFIRTPYQYTFTRKLGDF